MRLGCKTLFRDEFLVAQVRQVDREIPARPDVKFKSSRQCALLIRPVFVPQALFHIQTTPCDTHPLGWGLHGLAR